MDMQLQLTRHMHSTAETVIATPNSRVFQTIVILLILRQAFASITHQNLQHIRRSHINSNLFLLQDVKYTKHSFLITAIEAKIILAVTVLY